MDPPLVCGLLECGRVESNHHSTRRRGYSPLSSPMLSVHKKRGRPGWPAGLEPAPRGSQPRMLLVYTTATTHFHRPFKPPPMPALPASAGTATLAAALEKGAHGGNRPFPPCEGPTRRSRGERI